MGGPGRHRPGSLFSRVVGSCVHMGGAMTGPPISLRQYDQDRPNESGLIIEPWLHSWRTSPALRRSSHFEVWKAAWAERIDSILAQSDTMVIMAVDPDNTDRIYGWICYDPPEAHELPKDEGPVVHFVYVKKPFRRFGIGTALLAKANDGRMLGPYPQIYRMLGPYPQIYPAICTHWTRLCEDWPPGALHYRPSLFKIRKNTTTRRRRSRR